MPHFFEAESADEVWRLAAHSLLALTEDYYQPSRLGPMREMLNSNFAIHDPRQRWVFSREPAINPAFAIAEVVWILRGRKDSAFLNFWNPALPKFAGQGDYYHGAYGHRLKYNLGFDQLERAYQVLSENPDSRQVVLQIWDGQIDFPHSNAAPVAADIPCNICSLLNIRNGRLEWTQIMRSNDLFLGTPHNFVQFTSLQEVLAGWLGVKIGSYIQLSNSLHCYEHDVENFQISEVKKVVTNTDDLSLPKEEADEALLVVEKSMDRCREADLKVEEFSRLLNCENIPEGYRNMFLIVAADSARRRGWNDQVQEAISNCTNRCLVAAWSNWSERTKK